jgi:hypothetical protein
VPSTWKEGAVTGKRVLWEQFAFMTHSVSIYRNLAVFHRGTNTYPSVFNFDCAHPQTIETYETMAAAAAEAPSARDTLSRIDMHAWGKQPEQAAKLALESMARYPDDIDVLYLLLHQMRRVKREPEIALLLHRLAELEGPKTEQN